MAVLVSISLIGLVVMTCLAAGRWSRSGRGHSGAPGPGQPKPIPIRSIGGPDAELFRILDDPRFADLRLRRSAPMHDRRPGTA